MKLWFPINNNTISLIIVGVITFLFFISGALDILDYFIVKVLLVALTGGLALIVSVILFKKSLIKNRLEDELQDDLD